MWWRIVALTLIGILFVLGLGFLTLSSIYLNDIQRQNSDLALFKSDFLQVQSQIANMNSTLTTDLTNANNTKLPPTYSLQVIRQNMTWLASSSQIINPRLANPLQGIFDVEGYSTMTVLLGIENVSSVGPVEILSQDVEITLGTVLWWTNMSEATQGLPSQGAGGFTEELNMNSYFDDTIHVYNDYSQAPSGNRTYFLDWQISPISVSTIETEGPYVSMLFFVNSTAPVNGWIIVDLYVYLRNG